jgi:O-acetylserine/cysteine efflux transporter
MNLNRRRAIIALTAAGLLWGTTVPLSKEALLWLPPGWLTVVRFALAAAILLIAARSRLRSVCTPAVLASGAVGYGGSVLVQNAGLARTSVSHAALLVGATPVLIAIVAARWHHAVARPLAWAGFMVSLAGVGLIVGGSAGDATVGGDGLVLAAVLISATFTVAQTRLLRGRDPVAVTAVQFFAAALAVLPVAVLTEGMPAAPSGPAALLATAGLAVGGTLLPFTLFAYGQVRVAAEVAGAFVNLEPLIGALAGVVIFGNPTGPQQVAGGTAILAGIALSSLPMLTPRRGLEAAGPGDRFRGHEGLPDQQLDLGVRGERDVAGITPVGLAVVDRGDVAPGRTDLPGAERLAPLVEELAEGVAAVDGRLDVDDAVGGVRVQPVETGSAADELALGGLLCPGPRYPDRGGDLAGRAVDEDRQVSVNVEQGLLAGLAADAVDPLAGRGRGRPGQRGATGNRHALGTGGTRGRRRLERAQRAQRGQVQPRRAAGMVPAAGHGHPDASARSRHHDGRADGGQPVPAPPPACLQRSLLRDPLPGLLPVPAALRHGDCSPIGPLA